MRVKSSRFEGFQTLTVIILLCTEVWKAHIQKHKLNMFGHIIRQEGIQREMLDGMADG